MSRWRSNWMTLCYLVDQLPEQLGPGARQQTKKILKACWNHKVGKLRYQPYGQRWLMDELEAGIRTIRRHQAQAVALGLIEVERKGGTVRYELGKTARAALACGSSKEVQEVARSLRKSDRPKLGRPRIHADHAAQMRAWRLNHRDDSMAAPSGQEFRHANPRKADIERTVVNSESAVSDRDETDTALTPPLIYPPRREQTQSDSALGRTESNEIVKEDGDGDMQGEGAEVTSEEHGDVVDDDEPVDDRPVEWLEGGLADHLDYTLVDMASPGGLERLLNLWRSDDDEQEVAS